MTEKRNQESKTKLGKLYTKTATDCIAETFWPTRCAICDKPNHLLCKNCLQNLAYIDRNLACPVCGAPFGINQCTQCNSFILKRQNLDKVPLDDIVSIFVLTETSKQIITTYKDKGEQRLSAVLARMINSSIPKNWTNSPLILTTIPMRKEAFYTRGFDHMDLIAKKLSEISAIPYYKLFNKLAQKDQRKLNAQERYSNTASSFQPSIQLNLLTNTMNLQNTSVIIIDDVFTTGATLYSAGALLKTYQFKKVYGLTLARVTKYDHSEL